MAITIRDVAQKAGVSIRTVTRVINHQGEISEATRTRVQQVVEDMGFRPNRLAQGLVSGKTHSIGLIIPEITDPFYPEVVLGVESVACQHQYSVFLCNTNDDPRQELAYIDVLASKQVDGIILCGTRLNAEQLDEISKHHPISMLTSLAPHMSACVRLDGEGGLIEITSHLIRLGHQNIGHIGWGIYGENERARGYKLALQQNNLSFLDHWIVSMPIPGIEVGYKSALQLFEQAPEITAVTCYNDLTAIGVLQACAKLGKRVPQDIAVVGFDDIAIASLVHPALTTMHIPRFKVGELVMKLLFQVMGITSSDQSDLIGEGVDQAKLKVHPELVIRESCGAKSSAIDGS